MKGAVVWLTGLPASGKTTLARRIADALREEKTPCCLLDGDAVRAAMRPPPGYDPQARDDFYATLGRLAAMLAEQELIVLVPATAHLRRHRDHARAAARRFLEVHVATPLEECARRDDKGLYAAARGGEIAAMPGVGVAYEPPEHPDVVASGADDATVAQIVRTILG
jgi:adenylylsulfate kinase